MQLTPYLRRVGRRIQDLRVQSGLRQIDVNERAGLTYRHYQNIEAGRVNVTLSTLCRISRVLKVSVKELLEECE
jgi:transcriptional regulator with XRE-family HTH domain